MTLFTDDLEALEERIVEHLDEAPGVERAIDEAASHADDGDIPGGPVEPPLPLLRTAVVVATSCVAAAVMLGGLFEGTAGRVGPIVAVLGGVAVAAQASRRKTAWGANLTIALGIVGTAAALVLPTGFDNLVDLDSIVSEAKGAARVMRPPAPFLPGWRLVVGFVMATVGFMAGWVAIELRRPALSLLVPLPALGFGAISVPPAEKTVSGIVSAVLFVLGLALLSSLQGVVDGSSAPGLRYELKRAVRLLPLLGLVVAGLALVAQSGVLFPKPRIDPTRRALAPKAVPLSQVRDRPLFTVASNVTGPWRIGMLDVYHEDEWRLPAFAESNLVPVPGSGVVDEELTPTVTAEFTIADLGGAVLPGLPNTSGIRAEGPRLSYDARTGTIRLTQGQIRAGLRYTVLAPGLPSEDDLRKVTADIPTDVKRALAIPAPPAEIGQLLAEAPPGAWDRLDFLRRKLLTTTVASGPGTPKAVPPSRVVDMLFGSKEGSPFEIVAAQAMLARWAGVPSRIGYGYDGGRVLDAGVREIRPRNGSSWLEVYFPGYKWLPVLGSPAKAKASLQPDGPTIQNPDVQPSTDIAVQVYFPLRTAGKSPFYAQVRRIVAYLALLFLVVVVLYLLWPVAWKAYRRALARRVADAPVRERVAFSYAEFRDLCTDLGLRGRELSPLGFLDVLAEDEEHEELAWLVTRVVWGDLRQAPTEDHALDAAELARALRKRVAQAQPVAIRVIASMSRMSLRHPYAPELARPTPHEAREETSRAA